MMLLQDWTCILSLETFSNIERTQTKQSVKVSDFSWTSPWSRHMRFYLIKIMLLKDSTYFLWSEIFCEISKTQNKQSVEFQNFPGSLLFTSMTNSAPTKISFHFLIPSFLCHFADMKRTLCESFRLLLCPSIK
jgi:hypothetical protein